MQTSPQGFESLSLSQPLIGALSSLGYETPTPIQSKSIPHILAGEDFMGLAQTGTGKTAAFALPLLERIDVSQRSPQYLILTPTRELAIQVAEAFEGYARNLSGISVLAVYGGQSMSQQLKRLKRGVHIVVGTPGRITDHLRRGTLKLGELKTVVLDEADEMLKMGFADDIELILRKAPATKQTVLFSATMPDRIRKIAQSHLRNPKEIKIQTKTSAGENIEQQYWEVSGLHKLDALTRILEVEQVKGVLIFVRTKNATVELAEKLRVRGFSSEALNGDMRQSARESIVEKLRSGDVDIVIATDVAARGLDVKRISHVVNYDVPHDTESYIHRIGRTGRAGESGNAILFISPREKRMLRTIERVTKREISRYKLPTDGQVLELRREKIKKKIVDLCQSSELNDYVSMSEDLLADGSAVSIERLAAVCCLLADEKPKTSPLPVESSPPARRRERSFRGKPGADRGARRDSRGGRPGGRSSGRPGGRSGGRSGERSGERSGGRPGGRSSGRPGERSGGRSGGRPGGRSGGGGFRKSSRGKQGGSRSK